MTGMRLDRDAARIVYPFVSVVFATVGPTLRGDYLLRVMPDGPDLLAPVHLVIYLSREKAKVQLERWARYHWRRIPVFVPKQGFNPAAWSARSSSDGMHQELVR